MNPFFILAIDGGAASGKSSTARVIAQQFHFMHVDTGLHYRSFAYLFMQADIFPSEASPSDLPQVQRFIREKKLSSQLVENEALLAIDNEVVPAEILRSESVNRTVSYYAKIPILRAYLTKYQKSLAQFAENNGFAGLVMEGRDIGSIVFPDADLCIFLTAQESIRIQRRLQEGKQDTIAQRDQQDKLRPSAPLIKADRAIEIDNTQLSLEEVVQEIGKRIQEIQSRKK